MVNSQSLGTNWIFVYAALTVLAVFSAIVAADNMQVNVYRITPTGPEVNVSQNVTFEVNISAVTEADNLTNISLMVQYGAGLVSFVNSSALFNDTTDGALVLQRLYDDDSEVNISNGSSVILNLTFRITKNFKDLNFTFIANSSNVTDGATINFFNLSNITINGTSVVFFSNYSDFSTNLSYFLYDVLAIIGEDLTALGPHLANTNGSINFTRPLNVSYANFDLNTRIGTGFVAINSSAFDPSVNASAFVRIYNASCPAWSPPTVIVFNGDNITDNADVYRSAGEDCRLSGACANITCEFTDGGNIVTFTALHFSAFAANGNANLTGNTTSPALARGSGTGIAINFTASYINATKAEPVNATCEINLTQRFGSAINANMSQAFLSDFPGLYFFNFTPNRTQIGVYSLNITCDSPDFSKLYVNFTYNVSDNVAPQVVNLTPIGNQTFNQTSVVNISVQVVEESGGVGIDKVYANVTRPDNLVQQFELTRTGATSIYNTTFNFLMGTLPFGRFNITIIANDTEGNVNATVNSTFFVNDSIAPAVTNLSPNNTILAANENVNISLNASDLPFNGSGVNYVDVNITLPISVEVLTVRAALSPEGDIYILNFSNTSQGGRYNYTINAFDLYMNVNSTESAFFIQAQGPDVTDVISTPVFGNQSNEFNLSATVTDATGVGNVTFNITDANGVFLLSLGGQKQGASATYSAVYTSVITQQTGNYTFIVDANDTTNLRNITMGSSFVISDVTAPNVTSPSSDIVIGNQTNSFNLTATVIDNTNGSYLPVNVVLFNVSSPSGTLTTLIGVRQGANSIFAAVFNTSITDEYGNYTYIIEANDTVNNRNATVSSSFRVNDVTAPNVTSPSSDIVIGNQTNSFNLTATVIDNTNGSYLPVNVVLFNVSAPSGYVISLIGVRQGATATFAAVFNTTIQSEYGNYTYLIDAVDSQSNHNVTITSSFTVADLTAPNVTSPSSHIIVGNQTDNFNLTATVFDNTNGSYIPVNVVLFNVSSPSGVYYSLIGVRQGNNPIFAAVFNTTHWTEHGNYTYVIDANDSVNNRNTTVSSTFVVNDIIAPNVTGLSSLPVIGNQSDNFNLTATIFDTNGSATAVGVVLFNVTSPDTTYTSLIGVRQGGSNTWAAVFNTTSNQMWGNYTYVVDANDTLNNRNASANSTFVVNDVTAPWVLNASPNNVNISWGEMINISVNASDNSGGRNVSVVMFNITLPDAVIISLYAALAPGQNDLWIANFSNTTLAGRYNYTINANDSNNNRNATVGAFFVQSTEVTNSSVANSTIANSTVDNVTVVDSNISNSYVNTSDVQNSSIGNSTVIDATVNRSVVENSSIIYTSMYETQLNQTHVENSTFTNTTAFHSTMNVSTLDNSTVTYSNVTQSVVNATLVENSTVQDSTVFQSFVNNSLVDPSNVTNSSVDASVVNDSYVQNAVLFNTTVINATVNKSNADNTSIVVVDPTSFAALFGFSINMYDSNANRSRLENSTMWTSNVTQSTLFNSNITQVRSLLSTLTQSNVTGIGLINSTVTGSLLPATFGSGPDSAGVDDSTLMNVTGVASSVLQFNRTNAHNLSGIGNIHFLCANRVMDIFNVAFPGAAMAKETWVYCTDVQSVTVNGQLPFDVNDSSINSSSGISGLAAASASISNVVQMTNVTVISSFVNDSTLNRTTVIRGSAIYGSNLTNTNAIDNSSVVKSNISTSSTLNSSRVDNSTIVQASSINSTIGLSRISGGGATTLADNSTVWNSTVGNTSLYNSTLIASTVLGSFVRNAFVDPSTIVNSTVDGWSNITDSRIENSTVIGSNVTNSTLNNSLANGVFAKDSNFSTTTSASNLRTENSTFARVTASCAERTISDFNSVITPSAATSSFVCTNVINVTNVGTGADDVYNSSINDTIGINVAVVNNSGLTSVWLLTNSTVKFSYVNASMLNASDVVRGSRLVQANISASVVDNSTVYISNVSATSRVNTTTLNVSTVSRANVSNSTVTLSSVLGQGVATLLVNSSAFRSFVYNSTVHNTTLISSNVTTSFVRNAFVDPSTIVNSTVDGWSNITDSRIENSTVIGSNVTNSTINASRINGTNIRNSNVTNTSQLINVTLVENVTLAGVSLQDVPLVTDILGYIAFNTSTETTVNVTRNATFRLVLNNTMPYNVTNLTVVVLYDGNYLNYSLSSPQGLENASVSGTNYTSGVSMGNVLGSPLVPGRHIEVNFTFIALRNHTNVPTLFNVTVIRSDSAVRQFNTTLSQTLTQPLPTNANFVSGGFRQTGLNSENLSTNLSLVADASNVSGFQLANENGTVNWSFSTVNVIGRAGQAAPVANQVRISNHTLTFNTSAWHPSFNTTAKVTFFGSGCPSYNLVPIVNFSEYLTTFSLVQAGGRDCISAGACANITCAGGATGNLSFTVLHFTSFAAFGNANLTIAQIGTTTAGQNMYYNASYVDAATGALITGATCNFSTSDAPSEFVNMTEGAATYSVNKAAPSAGTFTVNITCRATGYTTINALDNVTIQSINPYSGGGSGGGGGYSRRLSTEVEQETNLAPSAESSASELKAQTAFDILDLIKAFYKGVKDYTPFQIIDIIKRFYSQK